MKKNFWLLSNQTLVCSLGPPSCFDKRLLAAPSPLFVFACLAPDTSCLCLLVCLRTRSCLLACSGYSRSCLTSCPPLTVSAAGAKIGPYAHCRVKLGFLSLNLETAYVSYIVPWRGATDARKASAHGATRNVRTALLRKERSKA